MATADKPHSPLTVESTPLLVDATAAAALCVSSAQQAGVVGHGPTGRIPRPIIWPFTDVEIQ